MLRSYSCWLTAVVPCSSFLLEGLLSQGFLRLSSSFGSAGTCSVSHSPAPKTQLWAIFPESLGRRGGQEGEPASDSAESLPQASDGKIKKLLQLPSNADIMTVPHLAGDGLGHDKDKVREAAVFRSNPTSIMWTGERNLSSSVSWLYCCNFYSYQSNEYTY